MSTTKDRLTWVLDHLGHVGKRDKDDDKQASDAALWAIARAYDRATCAGPELFGGAVDDDLLGQMRQAYAAGRGQLVATA
jgi:hypothetical protein